MSILNSLHPQAKQLAEKLIAECGKLGLEIKISSTWRTKAEQDALYAQGRTKPGSIITNAVYPQSQHCWGTAFDFFRNDGVKNPNTGKVDGWYDGDSFFTKVGRIGEKIGLEWGGSWTSFKDKPHFQLKGNEWAWRTLQNKYGTPDKFKATWGDVKVDTKPERNEAAIAEAKTIVGKLGKYIEISDINTFVLTLAENYNNSVWWGYKKVIEKFEKGETK